MEALSSKRAQTSHPRAHAVAVHGRAVAVAPANALRPSPRSLLTLLIPSWECSR